MFVQFYHYWLYLFAQNEEKNGNSEEIRFTIFISTAVIIFFVIVVIFAISRYQNKQKQYDDRERELENEFMKAAIETQEQILEELSERLHGNLQQTLSLAKINLNRGIANNDVNDFLIAKELVTDGIQEIKYLSKGLDRKYITGNSLEENIEKQLKRVQERTSLQTIFTKSEEEIQLSDDKHILLYRIVQESINNCINYAEATLLTVVMESHKKYFTIQIEDDGNGCDINKIKHAKNGLGIINMQKRTELINGIFHIESIPNQGTLVFIKIPYHGR